MTEMNLTLEFQGSEVSAIECQAGIAVIKFAAAYVRRSEKRAGNSSSFDAETGYVQSAQMIFTKAQCTGLLKECVGKIAEGVLTVNGAVSTDVRLPHSVSGAISLALHFSNGSSLSIAADSLECLLAGEPKFMESFAC